MKREYQPERGGTTHSDIWADKPEELKERRRIRRFFNLVSPAFFFIDRNLLPAYRETLEKLDFPHEWRVLDLATGTGTLARAFAERHHPVTALDFAERLLKKARKRIPEADLRHMDLKDLPEIPDESFDIVCMSYLLHGISAEFRHFILRQATRITARQVLIFDYPLPGPWYVRLIEAIEGPHYPEFLSRPFRKQAEEAGLHIFKRGVIARHGGWWLGRPASPS